MTFFLILSLERLCVVQDIQNNLHTLRQKLQGLVTEYDKYSMYSLDKEENSCTQYTLSASQKSPVHLSYNSLQPKDKRELKDD